MDDVDIWLTIGVLVVATAITRSGFWLVGHHITIPKRVQQMLRYAPACALAAIIGPDLLMVGEATPVINLLNPKLLGAAAATVFYLWRKSMIETILVGMAVFTILRVWLM